jgi:hypothetical protein
MLVFLLELEKFTCGTSGFYRTYCSFGILQPLEISVRGYQPFNCYRPFTLYYKKFRKALLFCGLSSSVNTVMNLQVP